jgi:hypothetical protein
MNLLSNTLATVPWSPWVDDQNPENTDIKLHQDSCFTRNLSKAQPVILISWYCNPRICIGSARAALDWSKAGILRSISRFLACLTCSVLERISLRRISPAGMVGFVGVDTLSGGRLLSSCQ